MEPSTGAISLKADTFTRCYGDLIRCMNRTQQIQRWRRYRRGKGGPHVGRWLLAIGAGYPARQCDRCLLGRIRGRRLGGRALYVFRPGPARPQRHPDRTGHAMRRSRSTIAPATICCTSPSIRGPFRGDRTYLKIDDIPQLMRDATIALEDRSFYTNIGVNFTGIGRAFYPTSAARACRAPVRSPNSWSRTS